MTKVPNQLRPDLLSVSALNVFPGHDSSGRVQMLGNHVAQRLVISGANERRCQTGMESEFGKYTFSIKMPVDGQIIKVINRYSRTVGKDSIEINPQTVVVYENYETHEIGILVIPKFCSMHQYFGFEYKPKEGLDKLFPGEFISKDTVFVDSPSVTDSGGYMLGREMNMAFMSHPAASEDGVLISEDVLHYFSFPTYETRIVEWGSKAFPLNLYGTVDKFKAFPDIGEYIRDDGILMMLRTFDKNLAPVEQSIYDLMEPDFIFDKATYVSGGGGRIIDIRVHHEDTTQSPTPTGMEDQANKYDRARKTFYTEIVDVWKRLKKERSEALVITPEFHRLIVEGLAVIDKGDDKRINKLFKKAPLDDYRIEFVIEYKTKPTIGFKITDFHGGKGVFCHIAKPEEMPVDEAGNRADIVMDANSTIGRMNLGRLYEHYFNSASRDVSKTVVGMSTFDPKDKFLSHKVFNLFRENKQHFMKIYDYILGYYSIVSPKMHKFFSVETDEKGKIDHMTAVIKNGIYLYIPTDNEPESVDMIKQIQKYYRPTYGPVTYIGNSGKKVTTKNPCRIASLYMMLLEKTGDDWAAVSSGKLQLYGILSQITKSDKYSQPTRNQAVRAIGETEGRIFVSYCGQRLVAEIMDRNNSPATHKSIVWNLLSSDKPTNMDYAVDRNKFKYGGAKPIQLVGHIAYVSGWKFSYSTEGNL